jgi:hypothetical protein
MSIIDIINNYNEKKQVINNHKEVIASLIAVINELKKEQSLLIEQLLSLSEFYKAKGYNLDYFKDKIYSFLENNRSKLSDLSLEIINSDEKENDVDETNRQISNANYRSMDIMQDACQISLSDCDTKISKVISAELRYELLKKRLGL